MSAHQQAITIANDDTLTALIRGAAQRLVVLAPAVTNRVGAAIAESWRRMGAAYVTVILDVDPEVYRLGYGDPDALVLLEATAKELITVLHRQNGIRIGLVIADDTTIVYSPTAFLIEAGPRRYDCPNAVVLGSPPESVAREIGVGPAGIRERRIGLEAVEGTKLAEVLADLARNPPQRFDVSRKVRVFNAKFEFVEFELKNVAIDRKSVAIPSDLMGLAADDDTRRLLKTTFKLLERDDELSSAALEQSKRTISQEFLRPVKGYGNVILRNQRQEFERRVEQLRQVIDKFQAELHERLQAAIDRNRGRLHALLLPAVKVNPPREWQCRAPDMR